MTDTDDALKHFITSTDNPYDLLDLSNGPASTEKEIRSAWKKTALKFHPDKLRSSDVDEATANRLYILRQDAYGILSEPHLREQYDNALRAKEQKKQRDAAFTGKRKAMKEDLERRENAAMKRKRGEDEEGEFESEVERVRLDGQRRRRERAEMLRREAEQEERERKEREEPNGKVATRHGVANGHRQTELKDIDRVVQVRFSRNESTANLTHERLNQLFSRFGDVEGVSVREKKVKVDGEKHRKVFVTATVIFESIVGAHAAISDFAQIVAREQGDWRLLQSPEWANGQEPECIRKPQEQSRTSDTPTTTASTILIGADADDVLMIRLKNAEKKRREDKKRKEEEAAAAAKAEIGTGTASPPKKQVPTFSTFKANKAVVEPSSDEVESRRAAEKKRLEEEMRREEEEEEWRDATGNGFPA